MSRPATLLLSALLLAGCATTPGTSYYYDGDGDYYYADSGADVVLDGSYYGGFGHGGWGYGAGYTGGFGYGYGFGGYGGFHPAWYYGYPVHAWWLWPDTHDHGTDRMDRLQRDRALRSGLAARPTFQAPRLARPGPFEGTDRQSALQRRTGDRAPRRFVAPPPHRASGPSAPAPHRSAAPAPTPRSSAPVMRSAPVPTSPAIRKQ